MIDTNLVNWPEERVAKLMSHYKEILSLLGEDPEREGLLKTPERVAKAMLTLTRGYEVDPKAVLNAAKFKEPYSQMVIVKDIDFFSMCAPENIFPPGIVRQHLSPTRSVAVNPPVAHILHQP